MSDEDYGSDIEFTQELEDVLAEVEARPLVLEPKPAEATDIEDLVRLSPMEEFRKKGYLSVSDLVGTVWCEVQYDYRLRTLPYLPPSKRPEVITTKSGKEIVVNKIKVEDKERILKRGQVIHERLEREIHPEEIFVATESREDVWGLRFITMLSGMQSLVDLGVCREMPVVGFINGVLILGIIDEITRQPLKGKDTDEGDTRSNTTQTSLTAFFSPTKPRPPKRERTHKVKISDSKTRASGTLPRESDTTAGQLQVMLYKELFDSMLNPTSTRDTTSNGQSSVTMSFERVFAHLGLSPDEPFSEGFVRQSQPIVLGNMLAHGAGEARCLNDMVQVWVKYVDTLGLGVAGKGHEGDGKSEDHLELVYRRAGGQKKGKGKRKRRVVVESEALPNDAPLTLSQEEERQVQLAIAQSLETIITSAPLQDVTEVQSTATEAPSFLPPPAPVAYTEEEREKEEDAIALEVELAYRKTGEIQDAGELIPIRASQDPLSPPPSNLPLAGTTTTVTDLGMEIDEPHIGMIPEEFEDEDPKSGGIIGRHRFKYNANLLANHLESVMSYWHGRRQPSGVGIEDTRRCGWCEFEEGCEWRVQKAEEAMAKMKLRRAQI